MSIRGKAIDEVKIGDRIVVHVLSPKEKVMLLTVTDKDPLFNRVFCDNVIPVRPNKDEEFIVIEN